MVDYLLDECVVTLCMKIAIFERDAATYLMVPVRANPQQKLTA